MQIEELESQFAEYDELLSRLEIKRNEIVSAFDTKRAALIELRSQKAERISGAASRILESIMTRALRSDDEQSLQSFLAADPMVAKVRQLAEQLYELGDTVRMEDVLSKLKSIGDDAIRQLRDRRDLFVAGGDTFKLGKHSFTVNRQPVELTMVTKEDSLLLHLTGTQYYEKIHAAELDNAKDLWQQSLRSESPTIYRAEFLAYELFQLWVVDRGTVHVPSSEQNISLEEFRAAAIDDKAQIIREVMQSKHSEGFQRGVHDVDTVKILTSLLEMHEALGILRFSPAIRGSAEYAWFDAVPDIERQSIEHWIQSHRKVSDILRKTPQSAHYARAVSDLLKKYASTLFRQACVARRQNSCSSDCFKPMRKAEILLRL